MWQYHKLFKKKQQNYKMGTDIIFELPGAFIRWIFGKLLSKDKKFKEYLDEDSMSNTFTGIAFILLLLLLYNIIK